MSTFLVSRLFGVPSYRQPGEHAYRSWEFDAAGGAAHCGNLPHADVFGCVCAGLGVDDI
ncbi:hypothetical protein [Nocardioides sp. 1609]|uniref:hypothetical protein n=1 Tax=Nocardioides sp. 1609 TaxID=2508327 RepID=UPI0014313DA7|nr:hypothetical protein [Nocardioides sp. 1609]